MRAVLEAATKIVKAMLLFIWTELTQMGVHSARLVEKEFIANGRFGSWLCENAPSTLVTGLDHRDAVPARLFCRISDIFWLTALLTLRWTALSALAAS